MTRAPQVLAAAALLTLAGCSSSNTAAPAAAPSPHTQVADGLALPTEPTSSGAAREVFQIESLQALVEQSDLVIIGRATDVAPGRSAGEDVGGLLGFRDVTVQIEQVLHGDYDGPTLTLEELGWKDGEPFTINEAVWAAPGDTMLLGLKATSNGATDAGPRYILTSTATRFFLEPDGQVEDNYRAGHGEHEARPFVQQAAELQVDELIRQVRNAG